MRSTPSSRPVILHVSADFPDPFAERKTQAIQRLVDLTAADFDNRVLSLNRQGKPRAVAAAIRRGPVSQRTGFSYGESWQYGAPALGLFHRTFLDRLGEEIAGYASDAGPPDLIIGHKLGVEGIAVARAAALLQIPYALTIQGNTDTKILSARPDLRPRLAEVFHTAATVTSFAPWSLQAVERVLGERSAPKHIIPCPVELDDVQAPVPDASGLVSVFNLAGWKDKNLAGMAPAFASVRSRHQDATLSVWGGGTVKQETTVRRIVQRVPGMTLEGAADPAKVRQILNKAAGMVLPSRRETFGMVFVEALFAGCPIIYPRDRAVSGYFDDLPFALAVSPDDRQAIASAMEQVLTQAPRMKEALADWQTRGGLEPFRRPAIAKAYRSAISAALPDGDKGKAFGGEMQ